MLEHAYADVNGVCLHYVSSGQHNARLIVFAHGFPEFWYTWKEQLAAFENEYHVVAFDLRGYNLSSKPPRITDYTIQHSVQDLCALVHHLGYDTFILIGHDWGGILSWAFAATYPAMLEKLVIINAPHPTIYARLLRDNAGQRHASKYILTFGGPHGEAILSRSNYAMLRKIVLADGINHGYITETDRVTYMQAWAQPGTLTAELNYYRASGFLEVLEGKGSTSSPEIVIDVSTLVIWGENDAALVAANLIGLEKYVSKLTIKTIPDGTHWVIHKYPTLVNSAIRAFLHA